MLYSSTPLNILDGTLVPMNEECLSSSRARAVALLDPLQWLRASFENLLPWIEVEDLHGVRVHISEDLRGAEVTINIPALLTPAIRAELMACAYQWVGHTALDSSWDEESGWRIPMSYSEASDFHRAVVDAVEFARTAVDEAARAHARGQAWTVVRERPERPLP